MTDNFKVYFLFSFFYPENSYKFEIPTKTNELSDLKKISDETLTYLVKTGIKDAFRELFERYAPRIYCFALKYFKNEQDAEEVVQDVFLKIWEKREMLDKSKNIRSFVFTVAVNTIYDSVRRKNIENSYKDFAKNNFDYQAESTWHEVIVNEMYARVEESVQTLPDQQRKVFILSKQKGLSNQEISQKLNISKRTVENQLYRALLYLKKHCQ